MPDIDDIWDDDEDMELHPMGNMTIYISPHDDDIAQIIRNLEREAKIKMGHPSNHHGSNPRRRK
jgi:hypothetical protein